MKPKQWLTFVEGAALEHGYARHALVSWLNGVDLEIAKWKLEEEYSPLLSITPVPDWRNPLESRDLSKPNLYDFLDHQEKANDFISRAISKVGEPELNANHWRTYTAALMNQDVSHYALTLVFLNQVRYMASMLHCTRNKIHGENYEPRLKALEELERFMAVFDTERNYYIDLKLSGDVSRNSVDLTNNDLIRHADIVMYGYANGFPRLIEEFQPECSSLLPWVLGESSEIDLSSFSFDQV